MEITVLGKSNAFTDAGGACSGYLLQEGDFRLLLDCGSGVLGKLRQVCPYDAVDAIVISHLHADHFLDLIPYSFALSYSTGAPFRRPRLCGPPGTHTLFAKLGEAIRFDDQLERVFEVEEYGAESELQVGPFSLRFQPVPHYIETFACEFTTAGAADDAAGARFVYGADCRVNEELVGFAQGADLLLLEATLGAEEPPADAKIEDQGHMSATQAGALGRRAGARRLLLSHFSDELDPDELREMGERAFGDRVEVAQGGARFIL